MKKIFKNELLYIFAFILTLVLVGCDQDQTALNENDVPFACANPAYKDIQNGMNKEEIRELLGQASSEVVKKTTMTLAEWDERFINRPMNEMSKSMIEQYLFVKNPDLNEYWIYSLDPALWEGDLEIYFDEEGKVNGKNCGWG